jgi:hypothetical protein
LTADDNDDRSELRLRIQGLTGEAVYTTTDWDGRRLHSWTNNMKLCLEEIRTRALNWYAGLIICESPAYVKLWQERSPLLWFRLRRCLALPSAYGRLLLIVSR